MKTHRLTTDSRMVSALPLLGKVKRMWWTIQLFRNLAKIAKNENETAAALSLGEYLYKLGLLEANLKKVSSDSHDLQVIKDRRMLRTVSLQDLQKLPEQTLGRVYADHMIRLNLDPNFFKMFHINDDSIFVLMRLRQTHDLWHVMTGFDTSVSGELGLQAFMMAQVHSPMGPLLIGGRLAMSALRNPQEARSILSQVARGWTMGEKAKPLFGIDWEKNWATPLKDLRRTYSVEL